MAALSEMFSGNSGPDGSRPEAVEPAAERAAQLRRGTEAAAASLPEERSDLAKRAVEAARAGATSLGREGGRDPVSVLEHLERLHFGLVRLSVERESADLEVVEQEIAALRGPEAGGAP